MLHSSSRRLVMATALGTLCLSATSTSAQAPASEPWRANWRLAVDLSTGGNVHGDGVTVLNTVGLDTHKVISTSSGDWATVVMQGYLTRADHSGDGPPGDASFMFRIFNANITRFGHGRVNVRVGHFEVPFGLEHVINTNGTLRDFMHGHNIGVKADWGVGVNGSWTAGEYEATWSRGTETTLSSQGGSYLVAGRVGTPSDGNLVLGVSALKGRVRNGSATRAWHASIGPNEIDNAQRAAADDSLGIGVIDRTRLGADLAWYRGLYSVLAESAVGTDSGRHGVARRTVVNTLAEVNRTSTDDRALVYVQGRLFSQDGVPGWRRQLHAAVGVRYAVDRRWSVSTEYAQPMNGPDPAEGRVLRLQLRHRF